MTLSTFWVLKNQESRRQYLNLIKIDCPIWLSKSFMQIFDLEQLKKRNKIQWTRNYDQYRQNNFFLLVLHDTESDKTAHKWNRLTNDFMHLPSWLRILKSTIWDFCEYNCDTRSEIWIVNLWIWINYDYIAVFQISEQAAESEYHWHKCIVIPANMEHP